MHRMPRYAVTTARAQQVSGRDGLRSAAGSERHAHALWSIFDRRHLGAEFHLEATAIQMFAQNCLGTPLRQTALKIKAAPPVPLAPTNPARGPSQDTNSRAPPREA
jgi:hypothetical protein